MATVFKEVQYNLANLVESIDTGVIGLPDIQRPFVWEDTKVKDLFDSMYKGYPVGYLLFWENAHQGGVRTIGTGGRQHVPSLLIVDGQQRLTSLYAVVKGKEVVRENYEKERIVVAFHPLKETFEIPDAAIAKSPEYIHNISDLWRPGNVIRFTNDFIANLKVHREVTPEDEEKIQGAIGQLHNILNFPFSALSLSAQATEEQVAEVFVRINSKGSKLNMSDFILTIMSVFWDDGRAALEDFCGRARRVGEGGAGTPFNYLFQPDPGDLLRVSVGLGFRRARMQYAYSILRGKDLETGEFSAERRDAQFAVLKEAQAKTLNLNSWHEFLKALQLAGYKRADLVSSEIAVAYAYTLFLIGKHDYGLEQDALRRFIARWFFFVSLTGRYTGSSETQMESDLAVLRSLSTAEEFVAAFDRVAAGVLTDDFWSITLPTGELATSSPRSPGLFAYYAALNILDADGLFSGLKVADLLREGLKENRSALERHHLFPKAHLERLGVDDQKERNQIANYALVEWAANDAISDEAPDGYLPRYLARYRTDEARREAYYWHALPEGWESLPYPEFLERRRRLMAGVIRDAYAALG